MRPKRVALTPAVREAKQRVKFVQDAVRQSIAAQAELRQGAAEWVALLRNKVAALACEVANVQEAAANGTILGGVIDPVSLKHFNAILSAADNAALSLTIADENVPLPPLLSMLNSARKRYPLAEAGSKSPIEFPPELTAKLGDQK